MRATLLAAALVLLPCVATSQDSSLRLYVLDGGTLVNPDPSWANLTLAEVKGIVSGPVPAYLILHPNGALLWDTGLPDDLLGVAPEDAQFGPWTQVVTTTIRRQLEDLGYAPSDIDFLALSHTHFDHAGNANAFADATWIVQRAELESVDFENTERWGLMSALENSEKRIIEGDHDVFGDGSVVLKFTPGHTPGHQSLFLDLRETGPIVLSGDLFHLDAHRRLQRVRLTDFDGNLTASSRASIERFLEERAATLWIQHELMLWATLDKAPLYYD